MQNLRKQSGSVLNNKWMRTLLSYLVKVKRKEYIYIYIYGSNQKHLMLANMFLSFIRSL